MSHIERRFPDAIDAKTKARFLSGLEEVDHLWSDERSIIDGDWFRVRTFSRIDKFTFFGCASVHAPSKVFVALSGLQIVHVNSASEGADRLAELSAALVEARRWERLSSITMHVAYRGVPFENLDGWNGLWSGRSLECRTMDFSGLSLAALESVSKAQFPQLESLKAAATHKGRKCAGDSLFELIGRWNAPRLATLDVKFNAVTGEGLQRFAADAKSRFPMLREIDIEFYTGEKIENCDWTGGVVDSYDVRMTNEEINERYLKGTGIVAKPYKK